jgi:hypothetical protein
LLTSLHRGWRTAKWSRTVKRWVPYRCCNELCRGSASGPLGPGSDIQFLCVCKVDVSTRPPLRANSAFRPAPAGSCQSSQSIWILGLESRQLRRNGEQELSIAKNIFLLPGLAEHLCILPPSGKELYRQLRPAAVWNVVYISGNLPTHTLPSVIRFLSMRVRHLLWIHGL